MLIEKDELLALLGLAKGFAPGGALRYELAETGRRARVHWDTDGLLVAEVTEEVDGEDAVAVVTLEAKFDPEDGFFDAKGTDGSGEGGDPDDPCSAAVAWRRLVRPMELSRS